MTAVYWAIYWGYVNIVQILIDYGAAVDIRDKVTNNAKMILIIEGAILLPTK